MAWGGEMKQCSSCGGDCGYTKKTGCQYADAAPTILVPRKLLEDALEELRGIQYMNRRVLIEEEIRAALEKVDHYPKNSDTTDWK